MIEKEKYILLSVPQLAKGASCHPGGQLTAANGLIKYLSDLNIHSRVLNTLASSYPPVPLWKKFFQSIYRINHGLRSAVDPKCIGYLAFASFGLSLYERSLISLAFKLLGKKNLTFFRSSEILSYRPKKLKRQILSVLVKIPGTVVVQSSRLQRELYKMGARKVDIVFNWLPPNLQLVGQSKVPPKDDVINFVFIGWLEPCKGVRELIDSILILKPVENRFRVYFAGSGSLSEYLGAKKIEHKLTNVFQLEWVTGIEVQVLLNHSHVLILPSHSEGFPNVVLEAMSQSLPVIATCVGGIPDVVKNNRNGFFVKLGDPDSLARAMGKYIEDHNLLVQHSREAIETVKKSHQLQNNCSQLMNILNIKTK